MTGHCTCGHANHAHHGHPGECSVPGCPCLAFQFAADQPHAAATQQPYSDAEITGGEKDDDELFCPDCGAYSASCTCWYEDEQDDEIEDWADPWSVRE